MRYGYFDDERREYVITEPRTPLPWINYLGSEAFFTLVSNTAGGYSFYRDARLRRLTRYRYNASPLDSDGFHIYIKEGASVWNPGWQPVKAELDSYSCRHGLGYTVISGEKDGLAVTQDMFVPRGEDCLLCRVGFENKSSREKSFDVFPYTEFCLWDAMDDASNFQRNFSTGEVETEPGVIYHKTEYRERRDHYAVFWSSRVPDSFDTARDSFIGVYGSPAMPEAVSRGACAGSVAHGWAPVAAMQMKLTLAPGEKTSFILGLGYIENAAEDKWEAPGVINKKKAHAMISRYPDDGAFFAAKKELASFWEELLSGFRLESGDARLDRMVSVWNQYQCMVTFNMSRSASYFESGMGRGMGFRDSNQDLLGFVHMIPERARERILDIAATQLPSGGAYHQYQPLTKKGNSSIGGGFNDDPLWLIAGVEAYLNETMDLDILSESVPFDNDPALAQPLMEHLRRSFGYTLANLGPHGLPLIGRADWNDCLNLNCFSEKSGESFQTTGPSEGPVAESVFIAGMFVKYGRAYARICRLIGLGEEASSAESAVRDMEKVVLDAGWDGEWFRRAYDAFGQPVGSRLCEEGQIYIEPQGMCVMAGIGVGSGEAERALKSVEERLDTPWGIVLLQPAYTRYHLELGEISSYPPGYKENAGIFCHNNPWIVSAETVLGHGDRAFDLYTRTCPAYCEDKSDVRRTEPYVYCQMVAGKDAPTHGEGKNSWLTGTAAWSFVNISQDILGVKPSPEGLVIDPCIPSSWKGYTVERRFRGALYRIRVENPAGAQRGVSRILMDGKTVFDIEDPSCRKMAAGCCTDGALPVLPEGSEAEVTVIMGAPAHRG